MRHALQPEFVEASELTRRLSDHLPAYAHKLRVQREELSRMKMILLVHYQKHLFYLYIYVYI